MKNLRDVMVGANVDDSDIDLGKLVGKKVARVEGYPTTAFGRDTVVFKLTRIVFDDGSSECVEGEHDAPYLPAGGLPNLDNETLLSIHDEVEGN